MKGSKKFPLKQIFKSEKKVFKQLQDNDLTELDKIYLILAENSLPDSFNVLCYDLGTKTFEDWRNLDDENLKRFKLLPKFAKAQLKLLPFKAENTDFVNLALKHGKRPYQAQLHDHGVPFIPVSEIQVLKRTSYGPVSGAVFEAMWNKPSGERVKVCLRYDRSLSQRKNFIHEAEMAASLNHENILRLYGVVLPGLYTDSVALVVDYAEYGNLHESMPNQSVPSLVQTVTQLASALEYLENQNMKHRGLSWTSVFVVKPGKIKIGALWSCFHQADGKKRNEGKHSKPGEEVFWLGQFAKELFHGLQFTKKYYAFTSHEQLANNVFCPEELRSLFDQCCARVINKRPSLSHVAKTLLDYSLPKLVVTSELRAETPNELSCKEGEVIVLISTTVPMMPQRLYQ